MVKGYVKQKAKQTAIKAIDNAIKNKRSEKVVIKNSNGKEYFLFTSDKQKYSLKDLDKDIKIVNKFFKSFKSQNIMQIYKNIDYISKNKDNKFFSAKGKYNVNLVYRNILDHARVCGDRGFHVDKETISRAFQDLEIEAEKQYAIMTERITKSFESGYLDYDENKKVYTINLKGEDILALHGELNGVKDDDFITVLKYIKKNGGSLSLEELKIQFKESNIETVKKYCDDLYINGYLNYKIDNIGGNKDRYENKKYTVTEKARSINFDNLPLEEFYKLYKLNIFDKVIFEASQKSQGVFTINELNKNSKMIFKEILGSTKKAKETYEIFLEYSSFRIPSLAKTGLLNYRVIEGKEYYQATNYFYNTLEKQNLLQDFEIKSAADNSKVSNLHKHIFKLADENGLNIKKLLDEYKKNPEVVDADSKLKKIESACDKLVINGYMEYNEEKNCYMLTDKAREYMKTQEHFKLSCGDVKILEMIDAAKPDDNFEIKKFHLDIMRNIERLGMLNPNNLAEIYKADDRIEEPEKKAEIVKRACKKLAVNGYLDYFNGSYTLANKAREQLESNRLRISWTDIKIYRLIENSEDKLTIDNIKAKIKEEKEQGMIIGRLKKLESEGYVKYEDGGYKKTTKGEEKIAEFIKQIDEKKKQKQKQNHILQQPSEGESKINYVKNEHDQINEHMSDSNGKSSLSKYELQKWDKKNITDISENSIWSEELFRKNTKETDEELIKKKIFSIQKRLFTLEEMGLVKHLGEDKFFIKDSLFERLELLKEKDKGVNKFSAEQKEIIKTLSQFLNLTDKQIETNIYKDNSIISKSDIGYLLKQGYVEEYRRDLRNDGCFEKIYYLTTKGKKAASHITGVSVDKIFSSKVHGRPVELRHDLLIYSAYKNLESKLEAEGYRITNIMTDKQMKSKDMIENGKQRIEYPDLHVELLDTKSGQKSYVNIEIDCGYKPKTIKSKAENIDNLIWYTDTEKQYKTITKTLKDASVVLISM